MKRVLMVAFHFPPQSGSSGVQRTLRFVQHLPALGWQPLVLTAQVLAYPQVGEDLLLDVPPGTVVNRAFALDAARHLSIAGKYWRRVALPDRWANWRFDAVRRGLQMIEAFKPDLLWSTYPLATAHVIGAKLQQMSGLPWVADFRDPMLLTQEPAVLKSYAQIEAQTVRNATRCVFTTPGAVRRYAERYPEQAERFHVIENGYDEGSFAGMEPVPERDIATPFVLLHSGIVYPAERDPTALLRAIRQLADRGQVTPATLRLRFRAAVHDEVIDRIAVQEGVREYVELAPAIPYKAALQEMMQAGALLLLQSKQYNDQVPGKLYEYFRAQRPIVALSHPDGDTTTLLKQANTGYWAPDDSPHGIAAQLTHLLADHQAGAVRLPTLAQARATSRHARSAKLAELFDAITS